MDRRLRRTVLATLLPIVLLLAPASPASAACQGAELVPSATNMVEIRTATRCLINAERKRFGRRPLTNHAGLTRVAQRHSDRMVRLGFFDHIAPDGSDVLRRVRASSTYLAGVSSYAVGENIAWGSHDLATPAETVRLWMASSGHRRNILNRTYRNLGIGVADGAPQRGVGGPAGTYTTVFGMRGR